ncbi:MAG TPA: site-2 protease family protein [Candidatus Polarisedimenticolaceae bacterium]|nr:site-2 protease family protein [Candidatus Polarisedimenticolaceae bacterium]
MSEPQGPDAERRRIENLRAVLAGPPPPKPAPTVAPAPTETPDAPRSPRTWKTALGGIGATIAMLLGKFKFLGVLAGALKLKTLASMLISIAIYGTQWGLPFATGFVVLILIHELGHVAVLRQEGIPATAPVFIPFVGAFIAMQGRPRDAYVEAKVGIGGPIAGSIAAWITLVAGLVLDKGLLVTLGHAGILLNLFNLVPVSPLDGGRIAGAFTRAFWIGGYALGVVALVLTRSPILLIILVVGLFTLWQRWKNPIPGYDEIPRGKRLAIGLAYAVLVIALAATLPIGMQIHPAAGQV